jgi:fibronectin type 3 domain-containing protein
MNSASRLFASLGFLALLLGCGAGSDRGIGGEEEQAVSGDVRHSEGASLLQEVSAALVSCKGKRSCDDGVACTRDDRCVGGVCQGTSYSCDDNNVCTTDSCDGSGGCIFTASAGSCSDGNACTVGDSCSSGACSGKSYGCDDGNPCTVDTCDGLGGCTFTPRAAACDDGNACTTNDSCIAGACQGTTPAEVCGNGVDDDCDGLIDGADPACGIAPPLAPSSTNAGPSLGCYLITWSDHASNEAGFRVERTLDAGATWQLLATVSQNAVSEYDCQIGIVEQICYRVFAFNSEGDSPPSNTDCAATPRMAINVRAIGVGSTIELTWTDNSSVEDGYEVWRTSDQNGWYTLLARLPANSTSYVDVAVISDVTYWYRVRVQKDGVGSDSIPASATASNARPHPPSLTNARPNRSAVQITWADNATNEVGFRVERSRDAGGTWQLLRTVRQNGLLEIDYDVALEVQVCYRVFAFNSQGDSLPSNVDCTLIPRPPTNLRAAVAGGGIELTWIDNTSLEDGYEIWRTDGISAWRPVAQASVNSTSYIDVDATNDVTYRYYVSAMRDGGISSGSNEVLAVLATFAPATPAAPHPVPWGSTLVAISWGDQSTNEEGFRVERSTDGGASWVTVGTSWFAPSNRDRFEFGDGGLTSEEEVCYRAIAYNSIGDSSPSGIGCTTPPAAPTGLTVTATPDGTLVSWTDNSAVEDGYALVLMIDCPESPEWWEYLPANSTSFLDSVGWWCAGGPALGYQVAALKDGGSSDWVTIP